MAICGRNDDNYGNSLDHVDEEDKGVTKRDTLGGTQKMTVINESGLYSLGHEQTDKSPIMSRRCG